MIKETSLEAYKEILKDHTIAKTQEKVIDFLIKNPNSSDKEIEQGTGLTINCVCGRRNELMELGIVRSGGKKENSSGRNVYTYYVVPVKNIKFIKKKCCLKTKKIRFTKNNTLDLINELQTFFETDMWFTKDLEWQCEDDMLKYLRKHFNLLKKQIMGEKNEQKK